jgi:hypothetical protein
VSGLTKPTKCVFVSDFCQQLRNSQGQQIRSSLAGVQNAHLRESFMSVVNERVIESYFAQSGAVFPAVGEPLSASGCARQFFAINSGIETANIGSLQVIFSDQSMSRLPSHGLLSRFLGNVTFEVLFLDCSK